MAGFSAIKNGIIITKTRVNKPARKVKKNTQTKVGYPIFRIKPATVFSG